jgi:hypothetical protein
MPRRTDPARAYDYTVTVRRDATGPTHDGHSALDPQALYDEPTFGLIAQSRLAEVVSRQIYVDDRENLGTEMAAGPAHRGPWWTTPPTANAASGLSRQGHGGSGTRSRHCIASGSVTADPDMTASGSPSGRSGTDPVAQRTRRPAVVVR